MPTPDEELVESLTPPLDLPRDDALTLLAEGSITIEGRITTASNATLYCRIEHQGIAAACVYKPVRGERPLWDFPTGTLAEREFAAYLVSEAGNWGIVPPTMLREGPLGDGMVQLWVDEDESVDVIGEINAGTAHGLQRMALFDAVINNSDRKVSHLLPAPTKPGHYHGVDHGVSFSLEYKLRTVLWQWAGDDIPAEGLAALDALIASLDAPDGLGAQLEGLLTTREVRATRKRIAKLRSTGRFPLPPTDWPAVPYPPY